MSGRAVIVVAACATLLLCGCDQEAPKAPAAGVAPQDAAASRRAPESRRPEELPPSRPTMGPQSPDVPVGSRDPVVDGMKTIIREMMLKGLVPAEKDLLVGRVVAILAHAMLGDEAGRKIEAEMVVTTLLSIQADMRKGPGKTSLGADDEQRIRVAAEMTARDLYRKLQMVAVGHAGGKHQGMAMRASPTVTVPAGYELVTWQTMGDFEHVDGMELPEKVRRLHGKKVGVAGYMMTIEEVEDIHQFLIVESFWSCCFGTPPSINQVVMVDMADKGVEYTASPVLVLGTMEVGEEIEDGFVTSVYRIKATSVTPTE